MKKTKRFLWALLPMAVALIFASCSSSDEVAEPTPADGGTKTIPVKITVGMDDATRATVGSDNSTLYFHTADKLAVLFGESRIALLDCLSIAEGSSSATFQGNMTVPTGASSYGEVTVVLIGSENVGVRENNSYQWNNDSHAICVANGNSSALNEAVKKYSYLTGTGAFDPNGQNSFTLTQHTAFLNIAVTFKDETAANTNLSVTVTNNNSTIGTGTVTTATVDNDVVAQFVVPVAAGTVMSGATIVLGSSDPITLSSTATLAGQSYRVEKTLIGGHEGVQLWEGGPYWAKMNVGATSEADYGKYFAWGETTGYTENESHNFDWTDYSLCNGSSSTLTKYCTSSNSGIVDNKTILESVDDAASFIMGSGWHIPTKSDMFNLKNNTTMTPYFGNNKYNDANGILLTGKDDYSDRSIFLPAVGYRQGTSFTGVGSYGMYWSMTIGDYSSVAARFAFINSTIYTDNGGRCYGFAIRAVHD